MKYKVMAVPSKNWLTFQKSHGAGGQNLSFQAISQPRPEGLIC